ncbi:hypothetical protein EJ08DRAFT_285842 [Tothia fuscella]|uniref:Uncharacterized protein n=1 Tax=Tothia fuscella TaxID=1048955 RepID=A0A9P4P2Z5_9PEZI|nr:hypothetical protein EJ08DRAFT_285842 [Tothia fuscella]
MPNIHTIDELNVDWSPYPNKERRTLLRDIAVAQQDVLKQHHRAKIEAQARRLGASKIPHSPGNRQIRRRLARRWHIVRVGATDALKETYMAAEKNVFVIGWVAPILSLVAVGVNVTPIIKPIS